MSLSLNGVSLRSQGWQVERTSGLDDLVNRDVPTILLPQRGAAVEAARQATAQPREFTATIHTKADDLTTMNARLAWLRHITSSPSLLAVGHIRRPDQVVMARCISGPADWGAAGAVAPYWLAATLRFRAPSPWWIDATDQTVTFGSTPVPIPLGPEPSRGVITITASGGEVVDPEVVYRNAAATALVTLSPAVTIADGDAWRIDCRTGWVGRRVSGVWLPAFETLPTGFVIPVLSPYDGVWGASSPTIETDAGAGSLVYRRTW